MVSGQDGQFAAACVYNSKRDFFERWLLSFPLCGCELFYVPIKQTSRTMSVARHPRGTPTFRRCGMQWRRSRRETTRLRSGRATPTCTPSWPPETWSKNSLETGRSVFKICSILQACTCIKTFFIKSVVQSIPARYSSTAVLPFVDSAELRLKQQQYVAAAYFESLGFTYGGTGTTTTLRNGAALHTYVSTMWLRRLMHLFCPLTVHACTPGMLLLLLLRSGPEDKTNVK